jgi:hypothetical protein
MRDKGLVSNQQENVESYQSTKATYCEHGAHDDRFYSRYRGIRVALEPL